MIDSKDISVVVQGAIDKKETPKCLKSIREYLPNAEIIISTWEGEDLTLLDFDRVVFSDDPGAPILCEHNGRKIYNNMNRQLLSTQAGLREVNRKYTLKLRSDLIIANTGFVDYFERFQRRTGGYRLFKQKIVTATLFTKHSMWNQKNSMGLTPFHISDWYFFGLTQDVRTYLADTPLAEEPKFSYYFSMRQNVSKSSPYGEIEFKFAPEQYFAYECFARNFDNICMEDAADVSNELMDVFEEFLVNNFIVLEFKQSGIYLNKYPYSKEEMFAGKQYLGLYHFCRYEMLYKKFCDKDYIITSNVSIFRNERYANDLLRVYKHAWNLIDPKIKLKKKLEAFFWGVPVTAILFLMKHGKEEGTIRSIIECYKAVVSCNAKT